MQADDTRTSSSAEAGILANEQSAERLAELPAHGAVDEEVEEIAEEDAQVHDAGGDRRRTGVENLQLEDVADDQRHEDDGHRELDEQKDADDDDQHQSRRVALGKSAELGASMVAQQSLATSLGRTHRVYESSVEQYEHRARQHVDEDDTEHVVDAEVDVLVTVDERRELVVAGGHVAPVAVHVGRTDDGREATLGEAESVRHDGGDHDADDCPADDGPRAKPARSRRDRVTDADVALDGQQHRQPDRRRVEDGRQVVDEALVDEAPAGRHPLRVAAKHVEVDVGRQQPDSGERRRDGQSDEDHVRWTVAHVRLQQDDADDVVRDDRKQHDGRRHVTADDVHPRAGNQLRQHEVVGAVIGAERHSRRRCRLHHRSAHLPESPQADSIPFTST